MNTNSFTKDQLALIYSGIKHMAFHYDSLESDNYIGRITRDILGKIEEYDQQITSPNYIGDHILED